MEVEANIRNMEIIPQSTLIDRVFVHDDCYRRHTSNRCDNCDWALIDCVQNDVNYKEGPIAADSITFFFSTKCGYVI